MKTITINILLHNTDRNLLSVILFFLNRVSEKNKEKVKLNFLISSNNFDYTSYIKNCMDSVSFGGIDFDLVEFSGAFDYPQKMSFMSSVETEYMIKWDEDYFINNYALDYMIENVSVLNENNLILAPVTSTGIPTSELFVNDYFEEEDRREIESEILKVSFPNIWGYDYSHLNEFTIGSQFWEGEDFYEASNSINYHYKGINPYRVGSCLQKTINDKILKDPEKIKTYNEFEMVTLNRYYTNHFFLIKTKEYKKIISDRSLYVDPFDEVPLNRYREIEGKNFIFVKGAFGIHPMYNTIYNVDNNKDREKEFMRNLESLIIDG